METVPLLLVSNSRVSRVWENGREYLVAPATSLREQVLAGSQGALFYPAEETARSAASWDRQPLVLYHPTYQGTDISAHDSRADPSSVLGDVRSSQHVGNGKLQHQLWFDVEATRNADKKLHSSVKILPRLLAGKPVALSTGLYTDNQPAESGSHHNGMPYTAVARNYRPDHIAILPDVRAACDIQDGCGVLVNSRAEAAANASTMPVARAGDEEDECSCGGKCDECQAKDIMRNAADGQPRCSDRGVYQSPASGSDKGAVGHHARKGFRSLADERVDRTAGKVFGTNAGPADGGRWVTLADSGQHVFISDSGHVHPGGPGSPPVGKLKGRDGDGRGDKSGSHDRGNEGVSSAAGSRDENTGRGLEAPAGGPSGSGAGKAGDSGSKSAGAPTTESVPRDIGEVNKRLDRYEKFFRDKGQHDVAGLMGMLRDHVNAVGTEEALKSLGPVAKGSNKEEVQYWGVGTEEANWKNMGHFMESYLARNGIKAVTGDTSDPNQRLISALGAPDKYVAGDFKPAGMHFTDKLTEAKSLPGLEKSEDISKVMGKDVTNLTKDVTDKLDAEYGKGSWIVKCYDDNAAAGYGIFFPQRVEAIKNDARNSLWESGKELANYGFSHLRDSSGKVVGIKHSGGDEYKFGSEKYASTIQGKAREAGDKALAAADHEDGPKLPEGSFMVQPAFKAVGISDEERAAGKTWHEKNEGRVHLVTRPDGNVEVIPHSTWLKGGNLPVVFEDADTRAMAKAAKDAIEKIPPEARKGQVYAPDVMKTADGYRVVELNAQGDHNGSGYLHDNHFTIDAYTSHLVGRPPAHAQFIHSLLSRERKVDKGTKNALTPLQRQLLLIYNRAWPAGKRDKLPHKDFAGPNQSFPITTQTDVDAAAHLIGKASDPEAVKSRIKAIAKRKGLALPASWATEETNNVAANAFCPTGEGGGHDNSCGGASSGAGAPKSTAGKARQATARAAASSEATGHKTMTRSAATVRDNLEGAYSKVKSLAPGAHDKMAEAHDRMAQSHEHQSSADADRRSEAGVYDSDMSAAGRQLTGSHDDAAQAHREAAKLHREASAQKAKRTNNVAETTGSTVNGSKFGCERDCSGDEDEEGCVEECVTENGFCATGKGGGADNSCGSKGAAAKGATKEAHEATTRAARADKTSSRRSTSTISTSADAGASANTALASASSGRADWAMAAHEQAAKYHDAAAAEHEGRFGSGENDEAVQAHRQAASAHRKALGYHRSATRNYYMSSNRRATMPLDREETLAKLTANCKCSEDLAVINELSDETLATLVHNATSQYVLNAPESVPEAFEDDDGDAEDDLEKREELTAEGVPPGEGGPTMPMRKGGKKMPPGMNRREEASMTYNEWLAMAPPEAQETHRWAAGIVAREKRVIVNQLVSHVADKGRKKLLANSLMDKSMEELVERLEMLPPPATNQRGGNGGPRMTGVPSQGMVSYLGAAGGPATNQLTLTDNEANDILDIEAARQKYDPAVLNRKSHQAADAS